MDGYSTIQKQLTFYFYPGNNCLLLRNRCPPTSCPRFIDLKLNIFQLQTCLQNADKLLCELN